MDAEVTPETAARFARVYVALVEAMMREGVPEDTARWEARNVAFLVVFREFTDSEHREPWED